MRRNKRAREVGTKMKYINTTAIEAVNNGTDAPDGYFHGSNLIAKHKYVSTDGWRGYSTVVAEPGYKIILDGWVTGDYDDAPAGHSESEVDAMIDTLALTNEDIWVIFTPTSNVFSTAYAVLARDPETKPVKGKTVGVKTKLFEDPDGSWRVQYHATDVISYNAGTGKYKLDSGGWATMTTAKRMNQYLPDGYCVYRRDWVLYVTTPDHDRLELIDGMEV